MVLISSFGGTAGGMVQSHIEVKNNVSDLHEMKNEVFVCYRYMCKIIF